jgi:hypothetical protein
VARVTTLSLAVVATALLVLLKALLDTPGAPVVVSAFVAGVAGLVAVTAIVGAWRRQPSEGSVAGPT